MRKNMRAIAFKPLTDDMKNNGIDKEHYCFDYNGFRFDVILSIISNGYEILVAIHAHNWGCVLNMDNNFIVEMPDSDYYSLRAILHLNWKTNHFNSSLFLQLLSKKAPTRSSRTGVNYHELRQYLPYRHVEESNKIYFCGWNDHTKDKRTARNFDKTEFYLGKKVADYCRKNNISSLWSDIPRDERNVTNPWT